MVNPPFLCGQEAFHQHRHHPRRLVHQGLAHQPSVKLCELIDGHLYRQPKDSRLVIAGWTETEKLTTRNVTTPNNITSQLIEATR